MDSDKFMDRQVEDMVKITHPLAGRYSRTRNTYQQSASRKNTSAPYVRTGNSAQARTVVLDTPLLKQSKLKDMGRKVVVTESENTDLQNNLFRNAKANVLNLDSLIANYNVESCFQGTIGSAGDVDYYQLHTAFLSFAHRPVYITMDAPQESGCRMAVYDKDGNQVGVSEINEDRTQTLKVPCDWSSSPVFTLKIEGGQTEQEIPYKLTFRQGEIDPEFQAVLDKRKNVPATPAKEEQNSQTFLDLNQIRNEKNEEKIRELHEKQYKALPEEERYHGEETAEELLARKKIGEKLSAAEEAYLRIYGNLKDIVDTENALRVNDTMDKLKEKLSAVGIRLSGEMRVTVSCDGSVKVSGLSEEDNALAEIVIREEGMAGELKNAYLSVSETVKNMSDQQYKFAVFTDELNRVLSKASGGKVTVDDIRIVERRQGVSSDRHLEGLPASLDKLINASKEDSIYEEYNKMLYGILEYRESHSDKPEFQVELEIGENGITAG